MPIRPSPTPQQGAESLPSPPGPNSEPILAPTAGNPDTTNVPNTMTSLFSQSRNHSKTDFENVLATLVNEQHGYTGNGAELAERVTVGISKALKNQAWGFLPDNYRWRLLVNLVREHNRLVPAIMWGNYTPHYLATAPEKELQDRILLMNSQAQGDFNTQLQRSASAPDPSVCPTHITCTSLSCSLSFANYFVLENQKAQANFSRTCTTILIGQSRSLPGPVKMPKPCGKPLITGQSAIFSCRPGPMTRFQKATARPP